MSPDQAEDQASGASSPAPRDPRQTVEPTPRDLRVLLHVGAMQWLAQYQAHALEFEGKSETVVSRSIKRLWDRGLVRIERFRGRGINLLRLTEAGASYLVGRAVASESELFVPRRRFDPRQLAHHLSVVDTRVALRRVGPTSRVLTCWRLRRTFASTTVPIPDLLVANQVTRGMLAIEIDRGTESLGGPQGLVEKLERLSASNELWGDALSRAVVVLTIGKSRIESLRARLDRSTLPVSVLELPADVGRPAIAALERLLGTR